jgi:type IV pilus assembly protein PilC
MREAGELSGQLPFVIRRVAIFLESRDELRKKTVNAFLYPALLLILATFTIFVFVFRVVPIFEELFSTFNTKLPFFTSLVVSLSEILRRFFVVGIIIAVIAAFIIRKTISTKQGRRLYENAILNTPLIGGILMALSTEKLTTTLGVLLKSGIPIIKAIEVSAKATQSVVFTERMEEAKVKVMAGLPLSDAMQQTGLFPPLVIQLVLVGEKTGNFSGMMEEISKYYSDLIDTAVTRFTTLLGPIVLIIMAFVIGGLIIAMFMPIFKLTGLG